MFFEPWLLSRGSLLIITPQGFFKMETPEVFVLEGGFWILGEEYRLLCEFRFHY